jgi:hypothetical protein
MQPRSGHQYRPVMLAQDRRDLSRFASHGLHVAPPPGELRREMMLGKVLGINNHAAHRVILHVPDLERHAGSPWTPDASDGAGRQSRRHDEHT